MPPVWYISSPHGHQYICPEGFTIYGIQIFEIALIICIFIFVAIWQWNSVFRLPAYLILSLIPSFNK